VWASEEAFQIYGIEYSSSYLDLPTIQRLVAKPDRPILDLALKQLLDRTGTYDVEFKIYRADNGLERSIHSIAELEFDQKGNPVRIVGVIQDVTAQKKAEEALLESEVRRGREIQRDAQLASRVQGALLSAPTPSEYLDINTLYKPVGYVGGDIYFLDWRYKGGLLRGFIADAIGHGLGTALHTASLHVLLREVNERDLPLPDAMRWLNRRTGEYFEEATFAGALGFELDIQTRQLRWVCAGIPKVWVATKAVQEAKECPGMCLGIRVEETFDLHTMPIEVGDCFYFMTDGLANLIGTHPSLPLGDYPDMLKLLQSLTESGERQDDATAVCICVRSLPESLVRQDGWPRLIRFGGYGDYQRLKGEISKILTEVTGLAHSLFEVAVHEALANAMECRDGVPRQHKARIRFNKIGSRLIVRVKTSRIGFAGNAILRRLRSHPEEMFSYGEDASMGRGIPMMLSIADKMIYNSEGTEVLLVWKNRPVHGMETL
jgi:PAS domain S-box-containing protein